MVNISKKPNLQFPELDLLNRKILLILSKDGRRSFADIAKELKVSTATILIRYRKLCKNGVIRGTKVLVNSSFLGLETSAFIGINLHRSKDIKPAIERLRQMKSVADAYYTTGQYSIFCKVVVQNVAALHEFLNSLQSLDYIQATETMVILDTPIHKELTI